MTLTQRPAKFVVVDPVTGTALDPSEATLVMDPDCSPVSGTRTSTGNLVSIDMDGYESLTLQVTEIGASTSIQFEQSEDNITWRSAQGRQTDVAQVQTRNFTSTTSSWAFEKNARYFRARVSNYGSGNVSIAGHMHKSPRSFVGDNMPRSSQRIQSAASTNATSVKTSSGGIMNGVVSNNGASIAYLKLYNKASVPTVGTDTPLVTYTLPAGGAPVPIQAQQFGSGIAYAITGGAADSDTTAVAANQVTGTFGWY